MPDCNDNTDSLLEDAFGALNPVWSEDAETDTSTPSLVSQIARSVIEPKSSASDGNSAESQPIPDMIAADKYIRALAAASGTNPNGGRKSAWGGVRMARAIPPSSV